MHPPTHTHPHSDTLSLTLSHTHTHRPPHACKVHVHCHQLHVHNFELLILLKCISDLDIFSKGMGSSIVLILLLAFSSGITLHMYIPGGILYMGSSSHHKAPHTGPLKGPLPPARADRLKIFTLNQKD